VAFGNQNNGFVVNGTGTAQVTAMIDRSTADNNGVFGVVGNGAQAFVIVTGSTLTRNGTGLGQLADSTVATFMNNAINFNGNNISGTITNISKK